MRNWAGPERAGWDDGVMWCALCGVFMCCVVGLTVGCHFRAAVWVPWRSLRLVH